MYRIDVSAAAAAAYTPQTLWSRRWHRANSRPAETILTLTHENGSARPIFRGAFINSIELDELEE